MRDARQQQSPLTPEDCTSMHGAHRSQALDDGIIQRLYEVRHKTDRSASRCHYHTVYRQLTLVRNSI
jgi:hypothetical protein